MQSTINADVAGKPVDVRHRLPPLRALTSIRFFAALYVVLFHLGTFLKFKRHPLVEHFLASGYTGVTVFFVLSGFILAYNYPAVASAKQFWIARFARIYPVYFLSIVAFLFDPVARSKPHFALSVFLSLGLVQAFWPPLFMALNPAAWTLSVEVFFYALFPLLIRFVGRMRWRVFLLIQTAYGLLGCIPLLTYLPHYRQMVEPWAFYLESSLPIFRLNTFFVGMFLGTQWLRRETIKDDGAAATKASTLVLALSGVASAALLCWFPSVLLSPVRTILLTWTFGGSIFALAGINWRVLTNRWLQMAGEISYSFYILQYPFFVPSFKWQRHFLPGSDPWHSWWSLLYLPVLICISYMAFIWIEIPARLAIRRALSGRPVPTRPI